MSDDTPKEDQRVQERRHGNDVHSGTRSGKKRRQETDDDWQYFEKRSDDDRRSEDSRRHSPERRHAPVAEDD